jgi:predicted AAA+ superfamily ATPase
MSFPHREYRFLEDPDVRTASRADPRDFLENLPDGAILDEIQRTPELLWYIQGRVDRHKRGGEFILTGSPQPALHAPISQSLAGRTAVLTIDPGLVAHLVGIETAARPARDPLRGALYETLVVLEVLKGRRNAGLFICAAPVNLPDPGDSC